MEEATGNSLPIASYYDRGGVPWPERRPLTERAGKEKPARNKQ